MTRHKNQKRYLDLELLSSLIPGDVVPNCGKLIDKNDGPTICHLVCDFQQGYRYIKVDSITGRIIDDYYRPLTQTHGFSVDPEDENY